MSTYLKSLTDEQLYTLLVDDELLTLGVVKEAGRRLRLYSHLLSYKSIDEHIRDVELAEKLEDMKHGLLSIS